MDYSQNFHDRPTDVPGGSTDVCELTRRIDYLTQRQVRDLQVTHDFKRVVLNGRSPSYYVKQLASQAVIDLLPGIAVENSIDVLS